MTSCKHIGRLRREYPVYYWNYHLPGLRRRLEMAKRKRLVNRAD